MGKRGPRPQPTGLRVLKGNPSKDPLPVNEIKPAPIAPPCPSGLLPEARKEWDRVAPRLEKLGLLGEIDMAMLAGYCQAYARWRQAEKALAHPAKGELQPEAEADGEKKKRKARGPYLTFATPNGYVQQRPEVAMAQHWLKIMRGLAAEFGLSPSARAGLEVDMPAVPGGVGGGAFDDYLNRGKKKA